MNYYYQTPTGWAYYDAPLDPVPEGFTSITEAQYNALVQAQVDAQAQADADALAQSRADWQLVYDQLVAVGISGPAATKLADRVGARPVGG